MFKIAMHGQTWSDEEVLALLDIWSDKTVQVELEEIQEQLLAPMDR